VSKKAPKTPLKTPSKTPSKTSGKEARLKFTADRQMSLLNRMDQVRQQSEMKANQRELSPS